MVSRIQTTSCFDTGMMVGELILGFVGYFGLYVGSEVRFDIVSGELLFIE